MADTIQLWIMLKQVTITEEKIHTNLSHLISSCCQNLLIYGKYIS